MALLNLAVENLAARFGAVQRQKINRNLTDRDAVLLRETIRILQPFANENEDVPQAFIDRLHAVREEYAALANEFELRETFDVDTIRSRINI